MTKRRVQQVILLCLLAFCVTAMHHVSASAEHQAVSMSAMEHPAPGHDGAHELPHLCLAVLTALGGILLLAWVLLTRPAARPLVSRTYSPAPDRPPDRRGRLVLTSLCVLRT